MPKKTMKFTSVRNSMRTVQGFPGHKCSPTEGFQVTTPDVRTSMLRPLYIWQATVSSSP